MNAHGDTLIVTIIAESSLTGGVAHERLLLRLDTDEGIVAICKVLTS